MRHDWLYSFHPQPDSDTPASRENKSLPQLQNGKDAMSKWTEMCKDRIAARRARSDDDYKLYKMFRDALAEQRSDESLHTDDDQMSLIKFLKTQEIFRLRIEDGKILIDHNNNAKRFHESDSHDAFSYLADVMGDALYEKFKNPEKSPA